MRRSTNIVIAFFITLFFVTHSSSLAKPVDSEKALKAANTFLQAEKTRGEKKLTRVVVKEVQKQTSQKRLDIGEIKEIRSEVSPLKIYKVNNHNF
jgi:hypothetical protein